MNRSEPRDRTGADRLVDELLPAELDWEHLVRSYPVPALTVAAGLGFLLGRHHGPVILGALSAFAGRYATRAVDEVLARVDAAAGAPASEGAGAEL